MLGVNMLTVWFVIGVVTFIVGASVLFVNAIMLKCGTYTSTDLLFVVFQHGSPLVNLCVSVNPTEHCVMFVLVNKLLSSGKYHSSSCPPKVSVLFGFIANVTL